MKYIKKIIKKIFFGKLMLQNFFYMLYKFSLLGMGYGIGTNVSGSGEKIVLNKVKEEGVIFDVGANEGQYIEMINKVFKGKVFVHSFEPSVYTFNKLVSNTQNIFNKKLWNIGLGDKSGEFNLFYNDLGSGLASLYKRDLTYLDIDFNKKEVVKVSTLDLFCKENNIKQIDLLKLDVEGNELNVLLGAKEMIAAGNIKMIQFEFGGTFIDAGIYFRDIFNFLRENYQVYRLLTDGLYEIKQYSEDLEIFQTSNFVAIYK